MSSSSSGSMPDSSSSSSAETPVRGIQLTRYAQEKFIANAVDGFRFKVVAHDAVLMPAEIFLYQRRPFNPTTGETVDEFLCVCSVPDLEEYPVAAPETGAIPARFRLNEIDLVFRAMHQADETWDDIQADVTVLKETLDLNDVLVLDETVQI